MRTTDRQLGAVTVLIGEKNGKYPHGNSLWIRGRDSTAVIDPSLSVVERSAELAGRADLVVQSHVHEDHVAGIHLFPQAQVYAHSEDVLGLRSLAGLMAIYGYGAHDAEVPHWVQTAFHYVERPDARSFDAGARFDLGGTSIRPVHLPGHTRGHCALLIEPEGVLFLGDIDLSSFGPYYGDAWSNLADFEASVDRVADIDACVWVSFHHVGVIEDRGLFLSKLQRFAAKFAERDANLLQFLQEPRNLTELVTHRFLYPPHATNFFIDAAERRTIQQHLDRLLARGQIERCAPDTYRSSC